MRPTLRHALGGLAAAILIAGLGLALSATAANARPTTSERPTTAAAAGFFMIVNNRTGKCVDVPDSSHVNGRRVQQWSCSGGDEQRWASIDLGSGFFLVQSKNTPSMCLNVRPTLLVEQRSCSLSERSQQWQWAVANINGDLVLRSGLPIDRCLALSPNTVANGTDIAVIPCSGTNSASRWHPKF